MKWYSFPKQEIHKCVTFCLESAKSQQEIEFGNKKTKARSIMEIARDNFIGKLAEYAFCGFLNKNGIAATPDYNIYPRGQWDDADFIVNGKRIDIKTTKTGGQWLMVEKSKLAFRQNENKLPDYFVFCIVGYDKEKRQFMKEVDISGYISLDDLKDCQMLNRGEFIPNTKTKLQADNYIVHVSALDQDWDRWISKIKSSA